MAPALSAVKDFKLKIPRSYLKLTRPERQEYPHQGQIQRLQ